MLIIAAAITTPYDCSSVETTATALRALGMRRRSSRNGRVGFPVAFSRSVGKTSGSCSAGGTMFERAFAVVLIAMAVCYIR